MARGLSTSQMACCLSRQGSALSSGEPASLGEASVECHSSARSSAVTDPAATGPDGALATPADPPAPAAAPVAAPAAPPLGRENSFRAKAREEARTLTPLLPLPVRLARTTSPDPHPHPDPHQAREEALRLHARGLTSAATATSMPSATSGESEGKAAAQAVPGPLDPAAGRPLCKVNSFRAKARLEARRIAAASATSAHEPAAKPAVNPTDLPTGPPICGAVRSYNSAKEAHAI